MRLSNRQIVAIAVTRPQTFEHILRGFVFTDAAELAVIEAMRIVGTSEDYQAWIAEVMDTAKALESRIDWSAWWHETIAVQNSLLSDLKQNRKTHLLLQKFLHLLVKWKEMHKRQKKL